VNRRDTFTRSKSSRDRPKREASPCSTSASCRSRPVPDVPQDTTKKLVPGTWLRFLGDTAAKAGYPVPQKAKTPRERDALAWAGTLRGFSDKLKPDADAIASGSELSQVVVVAMHRLEAEYSAQLAAVAMVRLNKSAKPR
jgi:hypothetical protein